MTFVRQMLHHFPPLAIPKKLASINSTSPSSSLIKGRYLHGVIYRHCEKCATAEVAGPEPVVPLNKISSNCYRDRVTIQRHTQALPY